MIIYINIENIISYHIIMYISIVIGLIIFSILLSQFIEDNTLKLCFWLLIFLLFITISNIYLSFYYYKKLREEDGRQGARGDPGVKGAIGSNGVCKLATSCGITNCRRVIEREFSSIFPEYNKVREKMDRNIILNDNDKKILAKINGNIEYESLINNFCSYFISYYFVSSL